MEKISRESDFEGEHRITVLSGVTVEALSEEFELERVDFETLLDEIRVG